LFTTIIQQDLAKAHLFFYFIGLKPNPIHELPPALAGG